MKPYWIKHHLHITLYVYHMAHANVDDDDDDDHILPSHVIINVDKVPSPTTTTSIKCTLSLQTKRKSHCEHSKKR